MTQGGRRHSKFDSYILHYNLIIGSRNYLGLGGYKVNFAFGWTTDVYKNQKKAIVKTCVF